MALMAAGGADAEHSSRGGGPLTPVPLRGQRFASAARPARKTPDASPVCWFHDKKRSSTAGNSVE